MNISTSLSTCLIGAQASLLAADLPEDARDVLAAWEALMEDAIGRAIGMEQNLAVLKSRLEDLEGEKLTQGMSEGVREQARELRRSAAGIAAVLHSLPAPLLAERDRLQALIRQNPQ